jgi:hypothetical protein
MSSGARDDLPLATVTAGGQEPLSSSPALALGLLTADPKRGRVLFFLNRQPTSEAAIDGLWSCAAGGAPQRLAPPSAWAVTGQRFGASPFDWADAVRGDNWLVTSLNGAIRIDLAKLSAERLWQVEPAGGTPLNASYDFRPPMAVVGEWLYDGQFRRAKLKGAAYEQLPALRPMEMKGYRFQLKLVEKTDRAHLIAADNCGLWVLELVDREGR